MIKSDVNIAIVVATHNRPKSLERCLSYLKSADYEAHKVDLIISVDKSDAEESILKIAQEFTWDFGEKTVRTFPQRQGLRKHILQCGDVSQSYDGVIVLEDDIVVSKYFFRFTAAVAPNMDDAVISGLSLYAPSVNEMALLPFVPQPTNFSLYFLQSAQSWGQFWTAGAWEKFRAWYDTQSGELAAASDLPARIYSWPESSWKKYFMKYNIISQTTWLYPYVSYTTNFSDSGTHRSASTNLFQVPLATGCGPLNIPNIHAGEGARYDAFFERMDMDGQSGRLFDLYGTRTFAGAGTRLVSTRKLQQEPVASYGLDLRPHELNVAYENPGQDIFEYEIEQDISLASDRRLGVLRYHANLAWRDALRHGWTGFVDRILAGLRVR